MPVNFKPPHAPEGEGATLFPPKKPTLKVKKPVKEMSSISFPYMDLENAIGVARAILNNGGVPMSREQLAGAMKQSSTSGAFILKVSAARQFGIIEHKDSKFQLTDLGFSVLDKSEAREKAARAQAFLNVALYRRLYEDFKNKQLPPRPFGLEQTLVQMGVAPKQKSNARLAFERSAKQAGYRNVDPDRLIEPILGISSGATSEMPPADETATSAPQMAPERPTPSNLDPLIKGMLDRLPKPGEPWSADKRKKWLETFASNLDWIYPTDDREPGGQT